MKRTKHANSKNFRYNTNEEPIVLSKFLLDTLLKDPKPSEVLALYTFYYYTAKWQQTNIPKATTSYVARALHWSEEKVRRIKNRLKDYGLIEDVIDREEESNKIIGHYIQLRFLWETSHPGRKPEGGFNHTMVFTGTNALYTNNKTLRGRSKKLIKEKDFDPVFWRHYPRKVDKGKCYTLWIKLCNRKDCPTRNEIRTAIEQQKKTERWLDGYIPLPYTWLNNRRWLDDPKQMVSQYKKKITVEDEEDDELPDSIKNLH